MIEYKAAARSCNMIIAPRFYPSSKTCSVCGVIKDTLTLDHCDDCGHEQDRDLNAALNLLRLDTFRPDAKRAQELRSTAFGNQALTVKPVIPLSLPRRDHLPTNPSPSAR